MTYIQKVSMEGFKSFKRKVAVPVLPGFTVFTGPNGSGKCLEYNSLIQMSDGSLRKIGDLVEQALKRGKVTELDDGIFAEAEGGDVLSLDIEKLKISKRPVKAYIKRRAPDNLIRLKTRTGREIIATEYHPLFVLKDDKIESIKAEDIKEGIRIAVPREIPVSIKTKIFYELLDLIEPSDSLYAPPNPVFIEIVKKLRSEKKLATKALASAAGVPEVCLKNLLYRQAVNFAYIIKVLRFSGLSDDEIIKMLPNLKSRRGSKIYKIPWKNSPEFAAFLGYLLAEGRLTKSNQIWFTNCTQEIVEDYVKIAKSLFGVEASINEYKANTYDVLIYSKPIAQLLKKFGMTKKTTEFKSLANLFLSHSSEEELGNFLNGLYSGDGYISDNSIEIVTKSRDLAFAVQTILLRLGIIFTSKYIIKCIKSSGFSGIYKQINIYGMENARRFRKYVEFTHPMKKERLENLCKDKNQNPNIDLIEVSSLVRQVTKDLRINVKKSKKLFPRLDSYCYYQCTPSTYGINYLIENLFLPRSQELNYYPQSLVVLQHLSTSDVFWDEIVSVEGAEAGEWVYDLTIEKDHNFIANNIVVHNSNLQEAVSFVLGLQSRSLRARKAEDLIFHGSKSKPASDHARVSVSFNNAKKTIPIQEDEVVISRTINKSGVSTYKINGKTVTKQELVDIFAQIRLSASGHNVMHQGDVTQIVEMSPIQRRQIIDEISGIAEYEDKKQKAKKELEQVAEKLREAEIILNERLQILERIKTDRDAAVEYKGLQEELELVRATLIWKEKLRAQEEIVEIDARIAAQEKETGSLEAEIRELDGKLDEEEKVLENITTEVMKASDRIEATRKITQLRSEIDRKRDKMGFNTKEVERIKDFASRLKEGGLPFLKELKTFSGVKGILDSLIKVPPKYRVAVEVSGGSHLQDVVVDNAENVVKCVKYLKENRLGRARFLPMDKINFSVKKNLPKEALGWLSELVQFDAKYSNIVNHVFGSTACVQNIDIARKAFDKERVRLVTLDGDLIEPAGSITGGFYKKKEDARYLQDVERLEEENERLLEEIERLEKELSKFSSQETKTESITTEVKKIKFDDRMKKFRERRKELYEQRLTVSQRLNETRIQRARVEARTENTNFQWEKYNGWETKLGNFLNHKEGHLKERQKYLIMKIEGLGPINLKATEEFDSLIADFDMFKQKFDKVVEEKNTVETAVKEIEEKRREVFDLALERVVKGFKEIWIDLTKGEADLKLENPENLESGLVISASPANKKLLNLDAMSGGEKTLTAIAFLFAIQRYKPCPFYILDEADAALDKINSHKLGELIKKQSKDAQFILVSHNDEIIKLADQVYGVSMEEGESKIIGVKLPEN